MGMSKHIYALRDGSDPVYQRNAAAVKALDAAGIVELPKELKAYFGIYAPGEFVDGETGLEVDSASKNASGSFREIDEDCSDVTEIDLSKLPTGTRFVRVRLSW